MAPRKPRTVWKQPLASLWSSLYFLKLMLPRSDRLDLCSGFLHQWPAAAHWRRRQCDLVSTDRQQDGRSWRRGLPSVGCTKQRAETASWWTSGNCSTLNGRLTACGWCCSCHVPRRRRSWRLWEQLGWLPTPRWPQVQWLCLVYLSNECLASTRVVLALAGRSERVQSTRRPLCRFRQLLTELAARWPSCTVCSLQICMANKLTRALDIFCLMRYINRRFACLLTYLRLELLIPSVSECLLLMRCVTLWPWPWLWPWTLVVHCASKVTPCTNF